MYIHDIRHWHWHCSYGICGAEEMSQPRGKIVTNQSNRVDRRTWPQRASSRITDLQAYVGVCVGGAENLGHVESLARPHQCVCAAHTQYATYPPYPSPFV